MFNLGELKDVLEVYKELKVPNDLGMTSKELKRLYKLRCKRKVQSSKEYLSSNKEIESQTVKFLIFTRRSIYLDNIVIYKGEQYNINHIDPYGNGYVELVCEVKR